VHCSACQVSNLGTNIAESLSSLRTLHPALVNFLVICMSQCITCFSSNVASATLFIPIVGQLVCRSSHYRCDNSIAPMVETLSPAPRILRVPSVYCNVLVQLRQVCVVGESADQSPQTDNLQSANQSIGRLAAATRALSTGDKQTDGQRGKA